MMDSFLTNFVVISITFLCLYITIPYCAGSELKDVLKNGVYANAYYTLSSSGNGLHRAVQDPMDKIAKEDVGHPIRAFIVGSFEIGFYLVFMYMATILYEMGVDSLFGTEASELEFAVKNAHAFVKDFIVFKESFIAASTAGSVGLLGSIAVGIFLMSGYAFITVIYFAFIYGLFEFKMVELGLARWMPEIKIPRDVTWRSPSWVFAIVYNEAREFLNTIAVPVFFTKLRYLLPTLAIIAIMSLKQSMAGETADSGELIANILDEMNVYGAAFSFIVSYLWAKLCQIILYFLYKRSRPERKYYYEQKSESGYNKVKQKRQRREATEFRASKRDYYVKEMHFE